MAFCNNCNPGSYTSWFSGYDLDACANYGYYGYDLNSYCWLNNQWSYDSTWDYNQQLLAAASLNSCDSTLSIPSSSSPPLPSVNSTYDFGASLNLDEYNSILAATNTNPNCAFGFNVNGNGNGNGKRATSPVALPLPVVRAPTPTPAPCPSPIPAATPFLWTPQPPVVAASSSQVLESFTVAPLNLLQTGCAPTKTASIKPTKPTKSIKVEKIETEPTKSSLEEDKLKNLKLIKEILEANRPYRLKRDDSLCFEDVLDFYEWLREKKRRNSLAKLF